MIFRTRGVISDTWHTIQVCSTENSKNQHIVGRLPPFPIGISKFNETYGIGKKTHHATTYPIFRLKGFKISDLHKV